MKILILALLLLGLSLTQSAAVTKNIDNKTNNSKPEITSKLENKDISSKIDKAKRETPKTISAKIEGDQEKNLKPEEASDPEQVERAKKSCQVIKAHPNSPTKICMEFTGPTSAVHICDDNGPYPYMSGQYQDNSSPSSYYPSQYLNPSSSVYVDPSSYNQPSSQYPQSPSYQFLYNRNQGPYVSNPYETGSDYSLPLQSPMSSVNEYSQNQQGLSIPYYMSSNPSSQESSYSSSNTGNYIIRPTNAPSTSYPNNYADLTNNYPGYSLVRQCTCKITPISNSNSQYISSYSGRSDPQLESSSTPAESVNISPIVSGGLPTDTVASFSSNEISDNVQSAAAATARTAFNLSPPAASIARTAFNLSPPAASIARTAINLSPPAAANGRTAINLSPSAASFRLATPTAVIGLSPVFRASTNLRNDGISATVGDPTNAASARISTGLSGAGIRSSPSGIISSGVVVPAISTSSGISLNHALNGRNYQYPMTYEQMRALNNFGSGTVQGPRYYRKLDDITDNEPSQESSSMTLKSNNQQKRSQDGHSATEKIKSNDLLKNYETQNPEVKQFLVEKRH